MYFVQYRYYQPKCFDPRTTTHTNYIIWQSCDQESDIYFMCGTFLFVKLYMSNECPGLAKPAHTKGIWAYRLTEFLHFCTLVMTWYPGFYVCKVAHTYPFWKFALDGLWWHRPHFDLPWHLKCLSCAQKLKNKLLKKIALNDLWWPWADFDLL